jgi:transposase
MYESDLRDSEWRLLAPYVIQGKMGRPRKHDSRQIINAIRYVMKSGCQWRMLPKEYPPWQTVYDYYLRWRQNGKWQEIHDSLVVKVREKVGKKPAPTVGIIDSQSAKTVQKGDPEATMPVKKSKAANAIL